MASWEDINDRDTLKAWLDGQPREVAVAIAARASLRVIPSWTEFCETEVARKRDVTPLPVSRSGLILSVAAVSPTDEINRASNATRTAASTTNAATAASTAADATANAATAAADAARATFGSTGIFAATFAANAVDAADSAAAWEAVRIDAQEVEAGAPIPTGPLWPGDNPLQKEWDATRTRWSEPGSPYDFWRRWYDSLLDPETHRVLAPDFLYKIALISNDTWDAGPEATAEAIREIEAGFGEGGPPILPRDRIEEAIAKTPYGETIEINPDMGKPRAVPDSELPGDISDYAARKMSGAVGLFNDGIRNQYTALTPELDLLRQALQVEPRLPVELFDVCASVSNRIRIHVEIGDLPEPAKDPVLADFLARIRDAAADIFAHDPKTRKMVEARKGVLGNDALVDERETVISATHELARHTEGVLARELPDDADIASNADADPEEPNTSSYRIVSRIVRIGPLVAAGGAAFGASVLAIADSPTFAASSILRFGFSVSNSENASCPGPSCLAVGRSFQTVLTTHFARPSPT